MDRKARIFQLLLFIQFSVIAAQQSNQDNGALAALMVDLKNTPPNWVGSDPCGGGWDGIGCSNSSVTSIKLSNVGLKGLLSADIGLLTELTTLDLSDNKELGGPLPPSIGNLTKLSYLILVGCSFTGTIPNTIGSLQQLEFLSLNNNKFNGSIPPSLGRLSNLYWLDLASNQLDGPIPVSDGITPGLDMLHRAGHFHFGDNHLSGEIPAKLFNSNMTLIHVLFGSNKLRGSIPSTLGLVKSLTIVHFDNNRLTGPVPSSLNGLINVTDISLSNNELTGLIPNLTGLTHLTSVDMSNNTFTASDVPSWVSTLDSLTTLKMENTSLQGQVPVELFSLSNLQTVVLSNNNLNGTLTIDTFSSQLVRIDMRDNKIDVVKQGQYSSTLILVDNPVCQESGSSTNSYCNVPTPNSSPCYTTPSNNCSPGSCNPGQFYSPNCKCAFPEMGTLVFRAPQFSNFKISSNFEKLEKSLMQALKSNTLPVDSVSLSVPTPVAHHYLDVYLKLFPSGCDHFNRTGISGIGSALIYLTFNPPDNFGPFSFEADNYLHYEEASSKSSSSGIIIGAVVGSSLLLLLLILAGGYALRQKRRAERSSEQKNPFAQWNSTKNSGGVPQLKGARWFSFEELKKCTNNFSEGNDVGSGGYGKVYRGKLPTGQLIAIKRASKISMQGGVEFKNEIELLSRVHHKNLVGLVGFCFEQGEQMLVYEYVPNGDLKDALSGKSGIRLDWTRRLKIAVGAARGLLYLHELADPPIIHRDVKSNNILLDEHLNAKVADFGLSKPLADSDRDHVTTQVKGTMGYLDPEYYMTQQLTEKSDVYSFGVIMLELVTARRPIERGKYIVREVQTTMDKTKSRYNLNEILDPAINCETLQGLENFVDLAMRCLQESRAGRPAMGEVVKEIENIMVLAGLNTNSNSTSTSANYEEEAKGNPQHPYKNDDFSYSGTFSPSRKIEPQ